MLENIAALEAAVTVCLADPHERSVHKLRVGCRRVEAQLALLSSLPNLPAHRTEARAVRRELQRMRHAAGSVRDGDVHLNHLQTRLRGTKDTIAEVRILRQGAQALLTKLEEERKVNASTFQHMLEKRQVKLARKLEALRRALKPAEPRTVPAREVLLAAHDLWQRDLAAATRRQVPDFNALSSRKLHELRKSAKTARYLAESVANSPRSAAIAKHYEHLQNAGGRWHDALELATLARREFGRKDPLSRELRAHRRRERNAFCQTLARFSATDR